MFNPLKTNDLDYVLDVISVKLLEDYDPASPCEVPAPDISKMLGISKKSPLAAEIYGLFNFVWNSLHKEIKSEGSRSPLLSCPFSFMLNCTEPLVRSHLVSNSQLTNLTKIDPDKSARFHRVRVKDESLLVATEATKSLLPGATTSVGSNGTGNSNPANLCITLYCGCCETLFSRPFVKSRKSENSSKPSAITHNLNMHPSLYLDGKNKVSQDNPNIEDMVGNSPNSTIFLPAKKGDPRNPSLEVDIEKLLNTKESINYDDDHTGSLLLTDIFTESHIKMYSFYVLSRLKMLGYYYKIDLIRAKSLEAMFKYLSKRSSETLTPIEKDAFNEVLLFLFQANVRTSDISRVSTLKVQEYFDKADQSKRLIRDHLLKLTEISKIWEGLANFYCVPTDAVVPLNMGGHSFKPREAMSLEPRWVSKIKKTISKNENNSLHTAYSGIVSNPTNPDSPSLIAWVELFHPTEPVGLSNAIIVTEVSAVMGINPLKPRLFIDTKKRAKQYNLEGLNHLYRLINQSLYGLVVAYVMDGYPLPSFFGNKSYAVSTKGYLEDYVDYLSVACFSEETTVDNVAPWLKYYTRPFRLKFEDLDRKNRTNGVNLITDFFSRVLKIAHKSTLRNGDTYLD